MNEKCGKNKTEASTLLQLQIFLLVAQTFLCWHLEVQESDKV